MTGLATLDAQQLTVAVDHSFPPHQCLKQANKQMLVRVCILMPLKPAAWWLMAQHRIKRLSGQACLPDWV